MCCDSTIEASPAMPTIQAIATIILACLHVQVVTGHHGGNLLAVQLLPSNGRGGGKVSGCVSGERDQGSPGQAGGSVLPQPERSPDQLAHRAALGSSPARGGAPRTSCAPRVQAAAHRVGQRRKGFGLILTEVARGARCSDGWARCFRAVMAVCNQPATKYGKLTIARQVEQFSPTYLLRL